MFFLFLLTSCHRHNPLGWNFIHVKNRMIISVAKRVDPNGEIFNRGWNNLSNRLFSRASTGDTDGYCSLMEVLRGRLQVFFNLLSPRQEDAEFYCDDVSTPSSSSPYRPLFSTSGRQRLRVPADLQRRLMSSVAPLSTAGKN